MEGKEDRLPTRTNLRNFLWREKNLRQVENVLNKFCYCLSIYLESFNMESSGNPPAHSKKIIEIEDIKREKDEIDFLESKKEKLLFQINELESKQKGKQWQLHH